MIRSARSLGRVTATVSLAATLLGPAPAVAARAQSLSLTLGFGADFDDNLLQYSQDQRNVFKAGTHPERYSIRSLDDQAWSPSAGLQWQLDEGRGRRHTIRARWSGDFHSSNPTADFHSFSFGWRESFHGERRAAAGYYWLPKYYLRQLIGEDVVVPFPGLSRHRRAEFSLGIASASWTQPVNARIDLDLAYQLERRRYDFDFRERDSDTHRARAEFAFSGAHPGRSLAVAAGFRWDGAKASDGDEPEAPPDDDVSYHGPIGSVEGRWEFWRSDAGRLAAEALIHAGHRVYDSNASTDRYHFGRDDVLQLYEFALRGTIHRHWSARAWYAYDHATATLGASAPSTSDVGSYTEQRVGLSLEWSGDLWRDRRRARAN